MRIHVFLGILVVCLCISACSDEAMLVSEQVFFGGDTEVAPGESTVGGLPEELQVLLFGDRDAMVEELLGLKDDDVVGFSYEGLFGVEARREWLLDQICLVDRQREYYTKYIDAGGIAVIGHYKVDDQHFYNAREVILTMTSKRPELRERLAPDYRYAVAGDTTGPKEPTGFCMVLFKSDDRGFPTMPRYAAHGYSGLGSCGKWCQSAVGMWPESFNIWSDYKIVVHEFAHAIHHAINDFHIAGNPVHVDLNKLDTTFQARLEAAYAAAKANAVEDWEASLNSNQYWTGDYAMTNVNEYWAVGVEYWFNYLSKVYPEGDIFQGRLYLDAFIEKDPLLYALLDEWFPLLSIEVTISVQ